MTSRSLRIHRTSPSRRMRSALSYAMLILVAIAVGLPVLWFLVSSFKTESEYVSYPIKLFPAVVQWKNYVFVCLCTHPRARA